MKLVWISFFKEHCRTPRGEKIYGIVSGRKYKRVSIVAGKCGDKLLAPLQYCDTTESILFEYWFEHLLLPVVPKDSIIVMDNAAYHRKKKLQELVAKLAVLYCFYPLILLI